MKKCVLSILVIVTIEVFFETYARPDTYQLTEKEKNTLDEIGIQWRDVLFWERKPCNEFFDFACTNKEYPKSQYKGAEDLLQDILKENPKLVTETEEKYLKFASSCKNIKQEDKIEFIKWFKLDNSIGAWPAFEENWNDSKFNLPLAIGEMNSYNYPVVFKYLFELQINGSYENYLKVIKEDLLNIDQNENVLKTAFKTLGVNKPEEVLADAALFEKTFNTAIESTKSFGNIKVKYSDLSNHFPKLELNKQIEITYGEKFPDDYSIILESNEELQHIYGEISKLNPKLIANYFFCTFVFKTIEITYPKSYSLFKPVIKSSIIKHLYTENMKEIVQGMYITILEFLREYFKAQCSSEEIINFVLEDVFRPTNEENLSKEFKEISANDNECMKNYNSLQRIQNRRLAKPSLNCNHLLLNPLKDEMSDFTEYLANLAGKPSALIFQPLIFSVIPRAIEYYNIFHGFNFTNSQKECFFKQHTNEVVEKEINIILGIQMMLKVFSKWMKNYPDIVQQENKILQNYGLSSEKLHVLLLAKQICENKESFNMMITTIAKSEDYPQIYDCPAGSKLNAADKCTLL